MSTVTVRVISNKNSFFNPKWSFQLKTDMKPDFGCIKVILEDLSVSEIIFDLAVDLLWTAGLCWPESDRLDKFSNLAAGFNNRDKSLK